MLSLAYKVGAAKALEEADIPWDESDRGDHMVPLSRLIPTVGPAISLYAAHENAPEGGGTGSVLATSGGSTFGALGGALGGGLLGALIASAMGTTRSEVVLGAAQVGAMLGMLPGGAYGAHKGYQSAKELYGAGRRDGAAE